MGYANYVCRVGALAVALGVGAAVACPAMGHATTGTSEASSAESSTTTSDSTTNGSAAESGTTTSPASAVADDSPGAGASSPVAAQHDGTTPATSADNAASAPSASTDDTEVDKAEVIADADDDPQPPAPGEQDTGAGKADETAAELPTAGQPTTATPSTDPDRSTDKSPAGESAPSNLAGSAASNATQGDPTSASPGTDSADEPAPLTVVPAASPTASATVTPGAYAAASTPSARSSAVQSADMGPLTPLTDVASSMVQLASDIITAALGPLAPGGGTATTALWTMLAFARREIGDAAQRLTTLVPGTVNELTSVQSIDFPDPLDPGSWLDWIESTAMDLGDVLRNFFIPIFFNRTPIASPMQVELDLSNGVVSGAIPFTAYDPDGNAIVYSVPEQGLPGGPSHGTVVVDNATGTFTYTPDEDFTGTDTFSFVASDDTGFHLHAWENLLNAAFGIFNTSFGGGHRDATTVTIFNNEDIVDNNGDFTPISGDFTIMTYNVAGLPFPLSSAEWPRITNTLEIGSRMNEYADIVNVQEDFGYHEFLVANALYPDQTAPLVPTWLWPIGVPYSDGLNTFSSFGIQEVYREAWWGCHDDNCLTPKGFSFTRMNLPGGETLDVYNLHANTSGGAFTNADIAQISNYIQHNSVGRAVIVTGDFNEYYSDPGQTLSDFAADNGFTDAWLELVPGATDVPPYANTCDYANDCEQLDKIFYRSATALDPNDPTTSPVQLQASVYQNLGQEFLNGDNKDLSDHRPQAVTFTYTVRNNGPVVTPLTG